VHMKSQYINEVINIITINISLIRTTAIGRINDEFY
jgi:hypothetical protein